MSKSKAVETVLWLALILAMAASIQHLAWTFGTVERPGYEWLGWIPALAVDTGLAALAYTIQQRKRAKRPVVILWAGVVGFASVSAIANLYHALAVEGVALTSAWITIAKAVVLSATLPVAYIFLGEIVSSDDAGAATKAEQDEQRRKLLEERKLRKDEQATTNEAKRLELEQQKLMLEQQHLQEQATAQQRETSKERKCGTCGTLFRNRQAYAAHACNKNGKAEETHAEN